MKCLGEPKGLKGFSQIIHSAGFIQISHARREDRRHHLVGLEPVQE